MKIKLAYLLIAVLTILGGLNIFQSLKKKFIPPTEQSAHAKGYADDDFHAAFFDEAGGDVQIDKHFKVDAGDILEIQVFHADVEILSGDASDAHIVVKVDGGDRELAKQLVEKLAFRVTHEGNKVRVISDSPDWNSWSWNHWGNVDISVQATIPARFNAEIETTHGDVTIEALEGVVDVRTTHGDVDIASLTGPHASIQTSHGDVEAGSLNSDEVAVTTSHGDIEIDTVIARTFTAQTSHADIEVGHVEGRAEITNSHGDIEVYLPKTNSAYLKTSHGDIAVEVDARQGADLILEGQHVDIDEQFRFNGNLKTDRAEGQLNGGGPRLEAHTSHGNIIVRES